MAHELATTNGKTAMAYFGETPWHGLGKNSPSQRQLLKQSRQLDSITRSSWHPLMTANGTPASQRKAVVRGDTNQVLGVVGNCYIPIQNAEAFEFLDTVVADGGLRYHTAGALGKGERIWLLAKLPGQLRVNNSDDITEKFLLLSNSHNGTSALRVFFTPIRVVCANTLAVAHRGGERRGISILHKGDLGAKVREAQKVLGLAQRFYDDVQLKINRLAGHYPTTAQLQNFFEALYPDPTTAGKVRAENIRQDLLHLFESGRGQDQYGVQHTTWAALNAVTEYVDHYRPTRARTAEQRANHRLQSQWFGSGAALKAKAWSLALDMVENN